MKIEKLEYVFSASNKIGSKTIAWGTAHHNTTSYKTPSHVCILVNDCLIIESTLTTGVRIIPYYAWMLSGNKIEHSITCTNSRHWDEVMQSVLRLYGRKYDYLGILYFSFRLLLEKYLKLKLPTKNKLQSKDRFFCVELIENLTGGDYEMTSPASLMVKLENITYDK